MVIGIFTDTYYPDINGVATATKTLAEVLKKHGHEVIIITTGLKGQKKFSFEDGIMRIPGASLKFLYDYRLAFFFNAHAYRILKKIHFDLFHIQQEFGISIFGRICAKIFQVPVVYTYHTSYADYSNYLSHFKISERYMSKLIVTLVKKVLSMKGEIVTPSLKTKKILLSYGVNRYINVVPNAVDFSDYEKEKDIEREKEFRKEYGLENRHILLYLGRVAKEKNIDELLDGFNKYKKDYEDKDTVLLIVGSGPDLDRLKEKKETTPYKDDIYFLGKVPHEDTGFYYQIADAFLSASLSETQGLTYSEAIASSCIVLAKYDFNLDYLIQDSKTGYFFDDANSLSERIHTILSLSNEEKSKVLTEAKRRNEYLFGKETYYERIMHVYEKALRHRF